MTKKTMIKAIERAVKNGWKGLSINYKDFEQWHILFESAIIFDIPFLKALFGEKECIYVKPQGVFPIPITTATQSRSGVYMWQYHGFEMMKADDRGKYLEDYLEGK